MATKTAKKTAKKSPKSKPVKGTARKRSSEPEIPPVDTPDLPPAMSGSQKRPKKSEEPDTTAALVEFLERRGYKINRNQFNKLTDAEQNNIRRWMEDVTHGKHHTVPPCLLEFDSNGNTRVGGAISPEDVPEKFCLPAKFGRVSYEDTGSVPIVIAKNALRAEDAEKLLCNTRLGVLIELRRNDERNTLLGESTRPLIQFEMDSKGYRSSKDGWHLTLKFGIDLDHLLDFGKFTGQEGRCELSRLGEIDGRAEHGDNEPHPDVEAGKDRPHGTPALDAAAAATRDSRQRKLPGTDADQDVDVQEWSAIPQTIDQSFIVRVAEFPDGKWRPGCIAFFAMPPGVPSLDENSFPDITKVGQVSRQLAITAIVDRWIGHLQKAPGGGCEAYIEALRSYLDRLRNGDTPESIDAELTGGVDEESQDADAEDSEED